jgi:hypothetical protein
MLRDSEVRQRTRRVRFLSRSLSDVAVILPPMVKLMCPANQGGNTMSDQGTRLVWESRLARLEAALARDGEEIGRTDAAENLMDTFLVLLLASPRLLNMLQTVMGTANDTSAVEQARVSVGA